MDVTEELVDDVEGPLNDALSLEPREESPKNFAPSPDFLWLCEELFIRVEDVQKQGRERVGSKPVTVRYYEVIHHFVQLWRRTVGDDIYPAFALILPYRDRRIYNIKDYTLVKAVCSYLALPKQSATEKRLLKWKRRATRGSRLSNFCVAEIKKRKSEPSPERRITIDKLNECLDQLVEERNAKGGFKGLSESPTFNFCLQNMTFVELKFFFDIILKYRLIGGQEDKLLSCWHPDAPEYLSVVSDLKTVTKRLWNPENRLRHDDLSINLGYAFVPQLAKKVSLSYEKICNKMKNDFVIEEKMDGERIQVHYMDFGSTVKFLSRRGIDFSYLYGESITGGPVAQYLKFNPNVKDCVLDGEMITYDVDRGVVLPFGLVKSSARQALSMEGICTQGYRPMLMVLDLVYLNGVSLIKLPLHQRKEYLAKILTPFPHAVDILSYVRCSDQTAIKRSLERAISMGSEGIVLKNFNSRYEIGARNDNWIKVKPEYLEQFGENMDLIIIGRDPGKKDSLMCALAVYENESDAAEIKAAEEAEIVSLDSDGEELDEPEHKKVIQKFVSFCIIANGISQEEFKDIDRRTRGNWTKSEDQLPPASLLEFGSKIPEEWIDPKQSLIIEVKARSLDNTESSKKKFAAGCTLHGGYCRRIRDDKDWTGCYSLSELWRERRQRSGTIIGSMNKKYPKTDKARRKRHDIFVDQVLETDDTGPKSNVFADLHFYVLSDYIDPELNTRITKAQLNNLIKQNGGTLVQNLISRHHMEYSFRIISGKLTSECKSLIDRGYDILSPQWILDCVSYGKLVKIEPKHCFNVSQEIMQIARERVDRFGDSFVSTISEHQLKSLITSNLDNTSATDYHHMDRIPELNQVPIFLFSGRTFYVPEIFFTATERAVLLSKIKLYGGLLASGLPDCNLIVVSTSTSSKDLPLQKLRESVAQLIANFDTPQPIPHVVTSDWIDRSIQENCQVPEEDFWPS
ncbi:hypothetical protein HG537_0G04650 [Torulaspora globosa]|uniref:DNA ligase n=1 Tax=Torulaspora globosa TaxID=48254 RepID=A0A7H9HXT7_9SACH|nr:hypothetical protein HG537_0G04650 [Torulaspora sp. CBS 2947]